MFHLFFYMIAMSAQAAESNAAQKAATAVASASAAASADAATEAPATPSEGDTVVFAPLPKAESSAAAGGAVVFTPLPQTSNDQGSVVFTPLNPTPALKAEPQVVTGKFLNAMEVKPILGATKANWVGVRDFNGQDLLYVTHLWSWRCGLLQMEVSVNGTGYEVWPLPACHENTVYPNAVLPDDGLPYRAFARGSIAQVDVRITYDDLSVEEASFPRTMVQLP